MATLVENKKDKKNWNNIFLYVIIEK
jgi:hypothetical protein